MKKRGLKLLVLLIALTLSMSNIVFANDDMTHDHDALHEHDINSSEVTILALYCDCGERMSLIDKEYGAWDAYDVYDCPDYYGCVVTKYKRTVKEIWKCYNCGQSGVNTYTEYKTEHSESH
jgi:hypothetical protein